MIRKPWQIWLVFSVCLIAAILAMLWLSFKTVQLDVMRETDRIQTELARQEAELQERISSALYRMDLKLLPLVALEASRPPYLYQSFYELNDPQRQLAHVSAQISDQSADGSDEAGTSVILVPSPLLTQLPKFVLLHFQIQSDGIITSPQIPDEKNLQQTVASLGVLPATIRSNEVKLTQASQFCQFESLLAVCPQIERVPLDQPMTGQNPLSLQTLYQNNGSIQGNASDRQSSIQSEQSNGANGGGASDPSGEGFGKVAVQQSRGYGRGNTEFDRRDSSTKELAINVLNSIPQFGDSQRVGNQKDSLPNQAANFQADFNQSMDQPGMMQPTWVDDKLILVRRVEGNGKTIVQCCWLDWSAIQESLKAEVFDLLPDIELRPVTRKTKNINLGTALTTIPVQLIVDSPKLLASLAMDAGPIENRSSGLRMSLLVAWCGLATATGAAALLLFGVMRLSERRAIFVSAVTHELRTPLTTFRLYAEMLAEKMVPAEKQQEYANTLKVQADRLSHLVENVLQFARLERGAASTNRETVTIESLFSRFSPRLMERAAEAEMDLDIEMDESISNLKITTEPSTIEQVIFNLVDNACKYAKSSADRKIMITCREKEDRLQFCVRDHGPGVALKYKKLMFQPFCKSDQDAANTAPGVGLGLALCLRMAKSLGGRLLHEGGSDGATFILELPRR